MTFEWDEAKSEWTKAERGFDFDYASTVFLDEERVEDEGRQKNGETLLHDWQSSSWGNSLRRFYLEVL